MPFTESTFASPTDSIPLATYAWDQAVDQPRGVVQVAHGLAEHSARYDRLAETLNAAGFLVYEWLAPSTVHFVFSAEQSVSDALGAPLPLGGGSWGASLPAFAVAFGLRIVAGLFGGERRAVVETAA